MECTMALELQFIHLMLHCNLMAMTQALSLDVSLAVYPPSFSNSSTTQQMIRVVRLVCVIVSA